MHRLTRTGLATVAGVALAAGGLGATAPTAQAQGPCTQTKVDNLTGQVTCVTRGPEEGGGSEGAGGGGSKAGSGSAQGAGSATGSDGGGRTRYVGVTCEVNTEICQGKPTMDGPPAAGAGPGAAGQPDVTPHQAAQAAIAKLQFTSAGPGAGPTRADNDLPFDAPVGYPVWLWADGGTTTDRSVSDSVGGMGVQIAVRFDQMEWNPGDGSGTITCGTGTPWVKGASAPAAKSPTCGYVYQEMGRYTLTASTHWTVTWTAGGQTGTVPVEMSQERAFDVGELQTVLTR